MNIIAQRDNVGKSSVDHILRTWTFFWLSVFFLFYDLRDDDWRIPSLRHFCSKGFSLCVQSLNGFMMRSVIHFQKSMNLYSLLINESRH